MRYLRSAALAAILGLGSLTASIPGAAQAQIYVGVSVGAPPPPLPVYVQPPIPGPGYIWTPGYWAWDRGDYYWVPGTWVLAPEPGFLWTPAYWGWNDGAYIFHIGYWGPVVGFYGGIDYGFGYTGFGYEGGYWNHDRFFYNRAVNNITNVNITNVYNRTVIDNRVTRVSYNGGAGGIAARPTAAQLAAAHQAHAPATQLQMRHQQAAAANPILHARANHGLPPIAATARPAVFRGPGVVPPARASATASRRASLDRRLGPTAATQGGRQAIVARSASAARAAPNHFASASVRQNGPRPGEARSAGRYGVPATAEVGGAVTRASPHANVPRRSFPASPQERRAPPAPPRYARTESFGSGGRGSAAEAFRAQPHFTAPRAPSAPSASPRPQGHENARGQRPEH